MDLSRLDIWGDATGQEHLEYELAHRLHSVPVARDSLLPSASNKVS